MRYKQRYKGRKIRHMRARTRETRHWWRWDAPTLGPMESVAQWLLRKLSLPLRLGRAFTTFFPQKNFCSHSKRTLRYTVGAGGGVLLFFFKCQSTWHFSVEEHPSNPVIGLGLQGGCMGAWRRWRGGPHQTCAVTQAHAVSALGKYTFSPLNYRFVLSPFLRFTFSASKWYPSKKYQ